MFCPRFMKKGIDIVKYYFIIYLYKRHKQTEETRAKIVKIAKSYTTILDIVENVCEMLKKNFIIIRRKIL